MGLLLCICVRARTLASVYCGVALLQLAELAALGIKGKTPGGGKWRSRAHHYNLRSSKGSEDEKASAQSVADDYNRAPPGTPGTVVFSI